MTLDELIVTTPWTEQSLADACDVTQSTINRLRRGKRNASPALALRLESESGGLVPAETLPLSKVSRAALAMFRQPRSGSERASA